MDAAARVDASVEVEDADGDVDMETLRLFTAAMQRAGGSHWTGHSLLWTPRPGTYGGPRWAHWTVGIHPVGRADPPARGPRRRRLFHRVPPLPGTPAAPNNPARLRP
ncbi:predicted protein [Streptomyces sp. C]|nr:predicted protein [Streptomyces sp. C]